MIILFYTHLIFLRKIYEFHPPFCKPGCALGEGQKVEGEGQEMRMRARS